jgi:hypothetical protein
LQDGISKTFNFIRPPCRRRGQALARIPRSPSGIVAAFPQKAKTLSLFCINSEISQASLIKTTRNYLSQDVDRLATVAPRVNASTLDQKVLF